MRATPSESFPRKAVVGREIVPTGKFGCDLFDEIVGYPRSSPTHGVIPAKSGDLRLLDQQSALSAKPGDARPVH
jgi:hypothetical protein